MQKEERKRKGFKRPVRMFAELLPSAQHGVRVLAPSPACGLLWAEDWLEHTAGTLSGRCRFPFPST